MEWIYYVPTYSDVGKISFDDITTIENFGINLNESHSGNMHMLVFLQLTECLWRSYQCKGENEQYTRYSTLSAGNVEYICIDFNGLYQESAILPTEVSTI